MGLSKMNVFTVEISQDLFLKKMGVSEELVKQFHLKSETVRKDSLKVRFRVNGRMMNRLLEKNQVIVQLLQKQVSISLHAFYFPYLLMLMDADGVVLSLYGDSKVMKSAESVHNIGVGASFSYSSIGANAFTSAMELQRPVFLQGKQHYLEILHNWSSICIPIQTSLEESVGYLHFVTFDPSLSGANLIYPSIETMAKRIEYEYRKAKLQDKNLHIEDILEEKLRLFPLTPREKEITMYWLMDYNYKQIGKVLGISEHTVRAYVNRVNNKFHVNSKASLIWRVMRMM